MAGDNRYSKRNTAYRGQRDYSILPRSPSEALEPDRAPEPPRGSQGTPAASGSSSSSTGS